MPIALSRCVLLKGEHHVRASRHHPRVLRIRPFYQTIASLQDIPCLQAWFHQNGYKTYSGGKVLHHGFKGPLKKAIDVNLGPSGDHDERAISTGPAALGIGVLFLN